MERVRSLIGELRSSGLKKKQKKRKRIEKREGGGFRMGNTCIPVVDSFRYLAKLIQYCKVKKKKRIEKKKEKGGLG